MKTQTLPTSQLFARTKKLAVLERRIGVEILECLREIERRKAYSDLGYDGLYTYCIKELGFTDSQAYQRIQAMRAVSEMPELKPRIESGALTVSAVSKVQTHLRREKKMGVCREASQKLALFSAVENLTSREVDVKLAEDKGEKLRTKLVLELDEELEVLWEQVKNLSAHRARGEPVEILRMLALEWLKKNDPGRELGQRKAIQEKVAQKKVAQEKVSQKVSAEAVHDSASKRDSTAMIKVDLASRSKLNLRRGVPLPGFRTEGKLVPPCSRILRYGGPPFQPRFADKSGSAIAAGVRDVFLDSRLRSIIRFRSREEVRLVSKIFVYFAGSAISERRFEHLESGKWKGSARRKWTKRSELEIQANLSNPTFSIR